MCFKEESYTDSIHGHTPGKMSECLRFIHKVIGNQGHSYKLVCFLCLDSLRSNIISICLVTQSLTNHFFKGSSL